MKRELKFRVWSKLLKEFAIDTEDGYFGQTEDFGNGEFTIFSGEDEIIQQFTGLKDKNGKEIYEGDIVRWPKMDDIDAIVVWDHKNLSFSFEWPVKDKRKNSYREPMTNDKPKYFVIGNIFENPELLKK